MSLLTTYQWFQINYFIRNFSNKLLNKVFTPGKNIPFGGKSVLVCRELIHEFMVEVQFGRT